MSWLCSKPLLNLCALMHRMAIKNQEDLAIALANQAFQKIHEYFGAENSLKDHKIEPPPVGDRRDHIADKALARSRNHGCLATSAICAPHRMLRPQSHLIAQ